MAKELLTRQEVAKVLRVTVRTIGNYIRDGKIQAVKVGGKVLIDKAQLDAITEAKSDQYEALIDPAKAEQLAALENWRAGERIRLRAAALGGVK